MSAVGDFVQAHLCVAMVYRCRADLVAASVDVLSWSVGTVSQSSDLSLR